MSGDISGDCSMVDFFQIDAFQIDAENGCDIQYDVLLGVMSGISDGILTISDRTIMGSWKIPAIPESCKGQTITGALFRAGLFDGGPPGTGAWVDGTNIVTGSFKFIDPTTTTTTTIPPTLQAPGLITLKNRIDTLTPRLSWEDVEAGCYYWIVEDISDIGRGNIETLASGFTADTFADVPSGKLHYNEEDWLSLTAKYRWYVEAYAESCNSVDRTTSIPAISEKLTFITPTRYGCLPGTKYDEVVYKSCRGIKKETCRTCYRASALGPIFNDEHISMYTCDLSGDSVDWLKFIAGNDGTVMVKMVLPDGQDYNFCIYKYQNVDDICNPYLSNPEDLAPECCGEQLTPATETPSKSCVFTATKDSRYRIPTTQDSGSGRADILINYEK
jgi:hypothetical protein